MAAGTWSRPVDGSTGPASPRAASWPAAIRALGALGLGLLAFAIADLSTHELRAGTLLGTLTLLGAAAVAERFPVPLAGTNGVSLSFVVGLAALILFGWSAGVVVFFAAPLLAGAADRRRAPQALGAAATGALAAALAAGAAEGVRDGGPVEQIAAVGIAAAAWYSLATLLGAALELSGDRLATRVATRVRVTALPFALMASAALALVVLWQRSPVFSLALAGPVLAIVLYGRSTAHAIGAMQLALTDPLTGLGNHRHFQERLRRELEHAEHDGPPLSLLVVDVDDFKRVNDRFGHPAGDRVLGHVAARLRHGGEAFRLGGDEFAVLLPGSETTHALAAAEAIVARIAALRGDEGESVTVSAGVATYPSATVARDDLVRAADTALYWAKEQGKNRVRAHRLEPVRLPEVRSERTPVGRAARHRAALSLARAVEARDALAGGHAERVSTLAARVAERLGLETAEVELVRLAGSLHDVGKLGLPPELLRKGAPLMPAERTAVERHAQIGFRMLESLGLTAVALAVLHHHERWDGTGYPDGLAAGEIPLAARILCVADALDAMTAAASYRQPLSIVDALDELERCAGAQFDPGVVAATVAEIGETTCPPIAV